MENDASTDSVTQALNRSQMVRKRNPMGKKKQKCTGRKSCAQRPKNTPSAPRKTGVAIIPAVTLRFKHRNFPDALFRGPNLVRTITRSCDPNIAPTGFSSWEILAYEYPTPKLVKKKSERNFVLRPQYPQLCAQTPRIALRP